LKTKGQLQAKLLNGFELVSMVYSLKDYYSNMLVVY